MKEIPEKTLRRLPQYLMVLKDLRTEGYETCSASHIAEALDLNPIQVRKDLALVSNHEGVPNQGRLINRLIKDIEDFLGYNTTSQAVLVGVGMLGRALLSYPGFKHYGVEIMVAFEQQVDQVYSVNQVPVYHITVMENLVQRMKIPIGIITVPKKAAQAVCDTLVSAGIKAIWNFAPIKLKVPEDVIVHDENMAESLAIITNKLMQK